jgi:outer membrane lipoprotein-sorting protein
MSARAAACLSALVLGACVQAAPDTPAPADDGAVEASTCIAAVNARVGSVSAAVTSVTPTATGAVVTLTDGAGPWRCAALSDGTVTDLAFGV